MGSLALPLGASSSSGMGRSLMVSLVLSFTHVGMAIMIAALSLPLVSVVLGSVGRAPLSRGLLGLIGVRMLWRGLKRPAHAHRTGQDATVGFLAGLIRCPLALFVMTFAISRGVPEAGIAFAVTMMAGWRSRSRRSRSSLSSSAFNWSDCWNRARSSSRL